MAKDEKAAALEKLKEQAEKTARVEAGFAFGEGSPHAKLIVVGEAPGKREAELGRPFVGAAGRLLNKMLEGASIDRGEVWITNVVKWRPTQETGGQVKNRAPRADEVATDSVWLQGELEIIRPKIILCMGNLAASALIHKNFKMNEERGRWFNGPMGSRALATFHPAYILRQLGPDRDRLIGLFESDFQTVKKALEEAVTNH